MPHIPAFAVADWLRSEFGSKQAHNQTGEGSGYYKFMHRRDTHFITEDHTLLLKSAAVYRKIEGDWIADPLEQTAMVDIQNYSPSRMPGNTVDRIGPGLGFSGDSRQSIISGITLVYHAKDPFVLCFSYGNYKELARKMLHRPPENYDGCVRIKDAKLLAELIYRTGETELGAVCDLFEKPNASPVPRR